MVHGAVFAAIANLFTMTFEIKMAAGMNFAQIRDLNPADGWTPFKKDSEHKKNVEQKSGVLSSSLVQMQGDLSLFSKQTCCKVIWTTFPKQHFKPLEGFVLKVHLQMYNQIYTRWWL